MQYPLLGNRGIRRNRREKSSDSILTKSSDSSDSSASSVSSVSLYMYNLINEQTLDLLRIMAFHENTQKVVAFAHCSNDCTFGTDTCVCPGIAVSALYLYCVLKI